MARDLRRAGYNRPTAPGVSNDQFAQRANDSLAIYNAEPEMPATNYASTKTPLSSANPYVHANVTGRKSAVVSRIERMQGLVFNWAWGGNNMYQQGAAGLPQNGAGLNGTVNNSSFQQTLIQLHDWQTNSQWYNCYPMAGAVFMGGNPVRGTYPSFRVEGPKQNVMGPGPTGTRMQPRPRFTAVQNIRRYSAAPKRYNTTSNNFGGLAGGGSSSTNGPGV